MNGMLRPAAQLSRALDAPHEPHDQEQEDDGHEESDHEYPAVHHHGVAPPCFESERIEPRMQGWCRAGVNGLDPVRWRTRRAFAKSQQTKNVG